MTNENGFYVAGVTFEKRQEALKALYDEYYTVAEKKSVELIPEPENKFDADAVQVVVVNGLTRTLIGYVPKPINIIVLEMLKNNVIINIKLADINHVPEKDIFSAKIKYDKRELKEVV